MPITLILSLGVISCTTNDQVVKPNPKTPFIKNTPTANATTPQSIVISKNNPANLKLKQIFSKPSDLQNLTSNQVRTLLGTPSFKRIDNTAEVWQYRNYKCTLDLFLYENLNTIGHSVAYFEIRLQPSQALTYNECFEVVKNASTQID